MNRFLKIFLTITLAIINHSQGNTKAEVRKPNSNGFSMQQPKNYVVNNGQHKFCDNEAITTAIIIEFLMDKVELYQIKYLFLRNKVSVC